MTTDNGVIRAAQILAASIDRLTDALVLAVEGEKDPGVAESPDKP